jgi:hypothetical protein
VENCASGAYVREKCYYWKIYTVSDGWFLPMYCRSIERGTQSFDGRRWKFDSFKHVSMNKEGLEPIYTVTLRDLVGIPSIGTYQQENDLARMYVSFQIDIKIICNSLPIVGNRSFSTQTSWYVTD